MRYSDVKLIDLQRVWSQLGWCDTIEVEEALQYWLAFRRNSVTLTTNQNMSVVALLDNEHATCLDVAVGMYLVTKQYYGQG